MYFNIKTSVSYQNMIMYSGNKPRRTKMYYLQ